MTPKELNDLALAFDMRGKEVQAGLHGWDASTQSLRVAILADIAAAVRQFSREQDDETKTGEKCRTALEKIAALKVLHPEVGVAVDIARVALIETGKAG
jgi:hypothetical protein